MSDITITDLLATSRIIPHLRARDPRAVIDALAARVRAETGIAKRALVAALVPAGDIAVSPASGVAILHTQLAEVACPIAAFATLDSPMQFNAADGHRSDVVVLLVSPSNDANLHLRALACLARRLRNRDVRVKLRAADSADAILAILAGMDRGGSDYGALRQQSG